MNGVKNGYGVFRWETGNVYKGNYRNDEREGYGEMYWIDGSVYKTIFFKLKMLKSLNSKTFLLVSVPERLTLVYNGIWSYWNQVWFSGN